MSIEFRSPVYEQASINIPEEAQNLQIPFNGSVCSSKGDEYPIQNNIIDLLKDDLETYSWAQSTNMWRFTAAIYEELWRNRSLSLLTGDEFPIDKEQQLLVDWLNPQSGELYLDIGCSTALYARTIKKNQPDCDVVALDFSQQMLREARLKAEADQTDLYLLRADARKMPFFGALFDGLMMGGTLNELTDPLKVLYEARRIIKKEGAFFMMHLTKAQTWYGRLIQDSTTVSGLQFWTLQESNELFERAGFKVEEQEQIGIVCFTKLSVS